MHDAQSPARGLAMLFAPLLAHAVEIYTDFPKEIHPNERYVFYSHGKIVEGTNEKPVSPEFGEYDFPAIKQALFGNGGFNLIAYHRPKDVDMDLSADLLASWVRKLIDAGREAVSHYADRIFSRQLHHCACRIPSG